MAIVMDYIEMESAAEDAELWEFVPEELRQLENPQTAIPQLAKDAEQMRAIEACVQRVPTRHVLRHGDARQMGGLAPESVHLVLTSPPYWTLKSLENIATPTDNSATSTTMPSFSTTSTGFGNAASMSWFPALEASLSHPT